MSSITISAQLIDSNIEIEVIRFSYQAGFNTLYEIELIALLADIAAYDCLISQPDNLKHLKITVANKLHNKAQCFYGTIFALEQLGKTGRHLNIKIKLSSECKLFWLNKRYFSYYQSSIVDVIRTGFITGLKQEKLNVYTKFINYLNASDYDKQASISQFEESDGDFITRHCGNYGINFFFQQAVNGVELKFADTNFGFNSKADLQLLTAETRQASGIFKPEFKLGGVPLYQNISLAHLNDGEVNYQLTTSKVFASATTNSCFLSPFANLTRPFQYELTKRLTEGLIANHLVIEVGFNGLFLQPGMLFGCDRLSEMLGQQTKFLVISVKYDFNKIDSLYNFKQHHIAELVPISGEYRVLSDIVKNQQKFNADAIFIGATVAKTEPDSIGSVALRYPFQGSNGSRYIKKLHSINYNNACLSSPVYSESNCLLGFSANNIDKPIMLGCIATKNITHIHKNSNSKRSSYALKTGQFLQFSNNLGANNSLCFGHNDIASLQHSFLLLGQAKHGFMQITNGSYKLDINGDYHFTVLG